MLYARPSAVRLSALLERRTLTVEEAVAITAQIGVGHEGQPLCVPTPSGLVLNGDGTLALEGCAEVAEPSKTAALARFLRRVLPPRSPAPLLLAVARGAGELTFPPFESTDAFLASIARFSDREPRAVIAGLYREMTAAAGIFGGIDDVRRARRASRIPLRTIAHENRISIHVLRQLEWGDFREWWSDESAVQTVRAYARTAGLDADAVVAVVERERRGQLRPVASPPRRAASDPLDRPLLRTAATPEPVAFAPARAAKRRQMHPWPLAAAAATVFLVVTGGAIVERMERASPQPPPPATAPAVPVAPTAPPLRARRDHAPLRVPAPSTKRQETDAPVTRLVRATSGEEPAVSPSFSSAGSALFSHDTPGEASDLSRADGDSFAGDLRVMRIVDDGARNYHVRPSPDGQRIAFDSDRDGERGVYLATSTGEDVHRVSGPGFAAIPSWSPDGTQLAFVREGRSPHVWDLWLLDLRSNEMTQLTGFANGQAWGGSWFPDGRRIAYTHDDQLIVADLEAGTRRTFRTPRRGALLRAPSVSPDGRHVAFQVYRDGAWLLDLKDGSVRRILDDPTAEEFAWDARGQRLAFHSRRSGAWSIWIMAPTEE